MKYALKKYNITADDELAALCRIDGVEHVPVLFASVGKVRGLDWREDRRPTPKKDPPSPRRTG